MEVTTHEAPGIKVETLALYEVIQRVGDDAFVGRPYKQIDLVYYIECQ